jgi:hypothetical protein
VKPFDYFGAAPFDRLRTSSINSLRTSIDYFEIAAACFADLAMTILNRFLDSASLRSE